MKLIACAQLFKTNDIENEQDVKFINALCEKILQFFAENM